MQVVLENEALKVTINSFGRACKHSGKATDTEYLWNADAKFLEENCPGTVSLCRKSEK